MALLSCSACHSDNDIRLDSVAANGAKVFRCEVCGHRWSPVPSTALPASTRTPLQMARGRFANPSMVAPARTTQVRRAKTRFLRANPDAVDDQVGSWLRHRELVTRNGLAAATPAELHDLATTGTGVRASAGSVFGRTWKALGDEQAAELTRSTIEYLLYGPHELTLEDRLTRLLTGTAVETMPGLKEGFFTKVLHVAEPDRFLPVMTYEDEDTGKRALAKAVFGLTLPQVDPTAMQIGRLIVWSNDLLVELAGEGFQGTQHTAEFLLWARDKVGTPALTGVG